MKLAMGWAAVAVLAAPLWLGAQQFATLNVSAEGETYANPDTALVQMEMTGQDSEMKAAYAESQKQADQVRTILRQQGFKPEQAHWSGFQVQPDFDPKTHHLLDYRVSTFLQLEISDFQKIAPLVDAAGTAGLSALRSVTFELKNSEAAKEAAIADAYRQIAEQAAALARAAGKTVGGLRDVNVNVSVASPQGELYRMPMASIALGGAMAGPTEQFTPGLVAVTARVQATYWLQP